MKTNDFLNPDNVVSTPTYYDLLLRKAKEQRRLARIEWLNIRDELTVEQNAHYLDSFRELDDRIRVGEDNVRAMKPLIVANCN